MSHRNDIFFVDNLIDNVSVFFSGLIIVITMSKQTIM